MSSSKFQYSKTPDHTINLSALDLSMSRGHRHHRHLKSTKRFFHRHSFYYLLFISCIFVYISYTNNRNMNRLLSENLTLKSSLIDQPQLKLSSIEDYGNWESGTEILEKWTSEPYKYGLLYKRSAKSADVILAGNPVIYNCFTFDTSGQVGLKFKKEVEIKRFALYYPSVRSKSSALKDFEIYTEVGGDLTLIGKHEYTNTKQLQEYTVSGKYSNIIIRGVSNHGEIYSTLYRVYIIGV